MRRIKELKSWDSYGIRDFCIRHEFYTCGDCKAYEKMLAFVDAKEPTTANLYKVAIDIMDHTDMSRLDTEGMEVTDFMYLINKECVLTFFNIME